MDRFPIFQGNNSQYASLKLIAYFDTVLSSLSIIDLNPGLSSENQR